MAEEKLLVKRDGDFCYPIYFENDFQALSGALKEEGLAGKKMCIVSDSTVAPLYAEQVKAELLKITDHVCQFGSRLVKHIRTWTQWKTCTSA